MKCFDEGKYNLWVNVVTEDYMRIGNDDGLI